MDTFKDVISDPATAPSELHETPTFFSNQFPDDDPAPCPAPKTPSIDSLIAARLKSFEKKKANLKSLSGHSIKDPEKRPLGHQRFYLLQW